MLCIFALFFQGHLSYLASLRGCALMFAQTLSQTHFLGYIFPTSWWFSIGDTQDSQALLTYLLEAFNKLLIAFYASM